MLEKEGRGKQIFRETLAENFPELMKYINHQI